MSAHKKTKSKQKWGPVSEIVTAGYPIYHYLIVENDPHDVTRITMYMNKHFPHIYLLGVCYTYEEAILAMPEQKPDLVFMDVRLNDGYTCFDVFANIPQDNYRTIFVTGSDSYVMEATQHNLVKYVVKPLNEDKIVEAVQRAHMVEFKEYTRSRVEQRQLHNVYELQRRITIQREDATVLTPLGEIIAFKTDVGNTNKSRNTFVVMAYEDINEKEFPHTSVQKSRLFDFHQLPPCFISGQSHVINVAQIAEVRPSRTLVFENGITFKTPESLYRNIMAYLGIT